MSLAERDYFTPNAGISAMYRPLLTALLIAVAGIASAQSRSPRERAMVVESSPTAQFNGGKKWAVVVGVNDYAFLADLEFCVDDARLIAKTLEEKCGYPQENILLIDSEQDEAGRRPAKNVMRRWLSQWLQQPEPGDTVFVYFSGHGFETDGKRYFAPSDCDPSEPESTCYSLEMLSQLMADCPARQKVLVLDCCRNDPSKSFGDSSGNEELAAAFENATGMITLASCRRGQVSWEWKEKGQGLYTFFLAAGLGGEADYDRDGIVDSGELNRFLSAKVPFESRKQGREQHPVEIRNDTTGVFALSQVQHAEVNEPAEPAIAAAQKIEASFTVLEEETKRVVDDALVKLYWRSESGAKLLATGKSNSHGMLSLPVNLTLELLAEGEFIALVHRGEKTVAYQLPNFPRQRTWPLTAPKLDEQPAASNVAATHEEEPTRTQPTLRERQPTTNRQPTTRLTSSTRREPVREPAVTRRPSGNTTTSAANCPTTNARSPQSNSSGWSEWSEWKPVNNNGGSMRSSGWSDWKPVNNQTRGNFQGNHFHNSSGGFQHGNRGQWNNGSSGANFGGGMFGFGF